MDKFENFYRLLRLKPGDTWEQLRASYKAQMRKWHPDRFVHDSADRRRAEENTKQINQAFQELGDYYNEHGRLPLDPQRQPDETGTSGTDEQSANSTVAPLSSMAAGDRLKTGSRRRVVLGLGLIGIVVYLLWHQTDLDPGRSDAPSVGEAASPDTPPDSAETGNTGTDSAAASFDLNSTLGEVYAIQGVPTSVEGDVWHYGDAWVFFRNGKVVRWIDTEPPILKTSHGMRGLSAASTVATSFARGSTKDEVRTIQGAPLRESGTMWEYGLSRVYFDRNGLVSGWEESPLDPLHVPH